MMHRRLCAQSACIEGCLQFSHTCQHGCPAHGSWRPGSSTCAGSAGTFWAPLAAVLPTMLQLLL
jgi:hypothetical protein